MSLWTKRHPIPKVLSNGTADVQSIAFEGKIWVVLDEKDYNHSMRKRKCLTSVFIFDPESEMYTEMSCVPKVWSTVLLFLAADETNLYMWRGKCARETDHHLFKLNRASWEWENVLTIKRSVPGRIWRSAVIINQIMLVLEKDYHNHRMFLIKIDLSGKQILETKTLPISAWTNNEFLTTCNNNLYLSYIIDNIQKVAEIKNGVLIEIAQEVDTEKDDYFNPIICANSNDFIGYSLSDGIRQIFEIRMFDFKSLMWKSEVTKLEAPVITDLYSVMEMNGLIYTLVRTSDGTRSELHVLDLHPKLTSICLADLANRFPKKREEQQLESVKQQLPIQTRANLEELLKYNNKI